MMICIRNFNDDYLLMLIVEPITSVLFVIEAVCGVGKGPLKGVGECESGLDNNINAVTIDIPARTSVKNISCIFFCASDSRFLAENSSFFCL